MALFLSSTTQTLGNQFPKEIMVSVHIYTGSSRAYLRTKLFSLWIPPINTIYPKNFELKNNFLAL